MRASVRLEGRVAALLAAVVGLATGVPAAGAPATGAPATSAPAAASKLPADSLLRLTWSADPQIAPGRGAERVAFVRTTVHAEADDYSTDVWLVEPGRAPRALTADPAADLLPRWSPDGRRLAFVSTRSGKPQIHAFDLAGGEPWQLTTVEDGVGGYAWSPDGTRIAFTSTTLTPEQKSAAPAKPNPKHAKPPFVTARPIFRNDGVPGWRSTKSRHLWVVDVSAGPKAPARRVTSGDWDHGDPQWSADGRTLYFAAVRKPDADRVFDDTELYAVPADGSREPVALTDRRGPDSNPVVSPDGRWIAYTGFDEASPPNSYEVSHLYVLDTRTGASRRLAVDFDRTVGDTTISDMGAPRGDGMRMVWRADSQAVYFTTADLGQGHLVEATLDGRHRRLTAFEMGEIRGFDVSDTGRVVAVHSGPASPPELRAFAVRDAGRENAWTRLTDFNAALVASGALQPYEEIWYEGAAPNVVDFPGGDGPGRAGRDRQWIQGWIVKPPGFDPSRQYPLILYVHGGPHAMYGTGFFHEFQVLANAGYVVLFTNPRGSSGYGEAFGDVIQYRYPGDDHLDLMAGVDALLARGYVDPQRLHIGGGSGGGLLTAWTIAKTDRFRKALVERAVTDWHSFAGTADIGTYLTQRWFRAPPWRDAQDYLARSPLSHVERVNTPVLVLHNQEDYRTAIDQALQYYQALQARGVPSELAVFPDSSHGMSREGRPSQRVRRIELIVDWFGR
ncbi:MAG: S9 family peptidase [Steroidobacteraceae bacterium]|jgi:dipeptidyl aminopeptidase/acylaminoacyl peptidase|nr:S9 family peptidase [Steroidobacteraceae bacterium]